MKAEELKAQMQAWNLNAAELAKVLCLHTTKVSEYLGDVQRIPCVIEFSIVENRPTSKNHSACRSKKMSLA